MKLWLFHISTALIIPFDWWVLPLLLRKCPVGQMHSILEISYGFQFSVKHSGVTGYSLQNFIILKFDSKWFYCLTINRTFRVSFVHMDSAKLRYRYLKNGTDVWYSRAELGHRYSRSETRGRYCAAFGRGSCGTDTPPSGNGKNCLWQSGQNLRGYQNALNKNTHIKS